METALFTFLGAALFTALLRERGALGAALAAAGIVLVRAEGAAWAAGFVLAAFVARGRRAQGPALWAAAGALIALIAQLAFRRAIYGEWLPNTVLAKSGGDTGATVARGLRYVGSWVLVTGAPLLAVLAMVPALRHAEQTARAATRFALVLVAGGVAYNLAVGGDWMPFFRFLCPLTPAIALVLGAALDRLSRRSTPLALGLAAGTCVLQVLPLYNVHLAPLAVRESLQFRSFQGGYSTERGRLDRARENRAYFETLGSALDQGLDGGAVLAFGAIGWVGWRAPDVDFLDRNGLVTPAVARREGTGDGKGTAGHEKRVPHAWFLRNGEPRARYLFATWVPGHVGAPGGPTLPALRQYVLTQGVTAQPNERPLFGGTVLRSLPIAEGPARGTTLLLLERAAAADAAAFWGR